MPVKKSCFVIISDRIDDCFQDLLSGLRTFCPSVDVAWYNSGRRQPAPPGVIAIPHSRPLKYAKITPSLFDMLEWAADQDYAWVMNVESDMAFIKPGFEKFVEEQLKDVDYIAPGFRTHIPDISEWPAYRSLRAELPELLTILGMSHTNRCFNPGQVFSHTYFRTLTSSEIYADIRAFVERNQRPDRSFTLQELILPTLVDRFGLSARPYPDDVAIFNRYRPYLSAYDIELAERHPDAYFIHPVRREVQDPVRSFVKKLALSAG